MSINSVSFSSISPEPEKDLVEIGQDQWESFLSNLPRGADLAKELVARGYSTTLRKIKIEYISCKINQLENLKFIECSFVNFYFNGQIQDVQFISCDMQGAELISKSDFIDNKTRAHFFECNLEKAKLELEGKATFTSCYLAKTSWCRFKGTVEIKAAESSSLSKLWPSVHTLEGANFLDGEFTCESFIEKGISLTNAIFGKKSYSILVRQNVPVPRTKPLIGLGGDGDHLGDFAEKQRKYLEERNCLVFAYNHRPKGIDLVKLKKEVENLLAKYPGLERWGITRGQWIIKNAASSKEIQKVLDFASNYCENLNGLLIPGGG